MTTEGIERHARNGVAPAPGGPTVTLTKAGVAIKRAIIGSTANMIDAINRAKRKPMSDPRENNRSTITQSPYR
jgi:hypothetical protein